MSSAIRKHTIRKGSARLPAFALLLPLAVWAAAPHARAADSWKGAAHLDAAIEQALADGAAPGAVAIVESRGRVLHRKAYGKRSLFPEPEETAPDTIFDCASLTKVVATAPAVMMLVEQGKVRLDDRVTRYLPGFRGSPEITVRHLLTHYSGLRPDLDIEPEWSGYETGIALAYAEKPVAPPGSRFIYSDINYILLAEIVREVSGTRIDAFAQERIFDPLGMTDTGFLPAPGLRPRIAPTERLEDGTILRGVVHDPTTRFMGGVSGHAGMFSTADDLARFARMMLNGGRLDGARILSPLSVLQMTTPQSPGDKRDRGIGWDIDSPYASPRGDLFVEGSYGHTGFTGTSMWLDPFSDSFVLLMTNRVHPTRKTSVVDLRNRAASIAAAAVDGIDDGVLRKRRWGLPGGDIPTAYAVRTGLDVLAAERFARLKGKTIGLITNRTGIDREGRRNVDLLAAADGVRLQSILTPEHGLDGLLDQSEIDDGVDGKTGLPVLSLYRGNRRRPTAAMLEGLDALVFDIQDVGARFYTYLTTMGYAMEAAAAAGIEFLVLDRPNPIGGTQVEGPLLDDDLRSFIGYHSLPVRHGMTVGELARMCNAERKIGAALEVVPMEGWRRGLWFDETELPWVNPSPNIRNLDQAILYPGIALLEGLHNYSVGRGTDTPFQFVGADWIDGSDLAAALRKRALPGIRVYARSLTPAASRFAGREISGVQLFIADRNSLRPTALGLAVATALIELYPNRVNLAETEKLIGNRRVIDALAAGLEPEPDGAAIEAFKERRGRFLLYGP